MRKTALGICCMVFVALVVSTYRVTNAVNVPAQTDTVNPAETSIALDLSVDQMVDQADMITIGSCVEAKSTWVDRTLVTLATISVKETLKGDASSYVTVALPGGIDANRKFPVAVTYPGAPRITPGEDVLLFLTRDDQVADGYTIAGFSQGKFSIVMNEEGKEMITRDLTSMTLQGKSGMRRGTTTLTPLDTLKSQITRRLQKQ
jgi:hypothetical protein